MLSKAKAPEPADTFAETEINIVQYTEGEKSIEPPPTQTIYSERLPLELPVLEEPSEFDPLTPSEHRTSSSSTLLEQVHHEQRAPMQNATRIDHNYCLPPVSRLATEYKCNPAPEFVQFLPPIPSGLLTKHFLYPEQIGPESKFFVNQLPKRTGMLTVGDDHLEF